MVIDLEPAPPPRPLPPGRGAVPALGAVTIAAYGVAYYAYGVLIGPIHRGTGWPEAALAAVFSATLVIGGLGGLGGGRLADRAGTRPALAVAGLPGAGAMFAASYAQGLVAFGALYALGCGLIGATAFYHVTQPAVIRLSPAEPARAVVRLTLLGALASPIFLPLTSWLVQSAGWRGAIRWEALLAAATLGVAALVANSRPTNSSHPDRLGTIAEALRSAWHTRGFRRWLLSSLLGGAAVDVVLVFQVPAMTASGLSLGAAAGIGAVRGIAQLGGRLLLGVVLRLLGTVGTIVATFLVAAAGTLCLLAAGQLAVALAFGVLAGASIGAISTLQGIRTNELVDEHSLGLLMGAQQSVFAVGSAGGPVLAGALIGATHSYRLVEALTATTFAGAAAVMATGRARND